MRRPQYNNYGNLEALNHKLIFVTSPAQTKRRRRRSEKMKIEKEKKKRKKKRKKKEKRNPDERQP